MGLSENAEIITGQPHRTDGFSSPVSFEHPRPCEVPCLWLTDPQWLDLSEQILNRLRGRMTLIQPAAERRQKIIEALEALYDEPDHPHLLVLPSQAARDDFVEQFLSYDLIEDLLHDPTVEDIMINGTESIFVHKTGQGSVRIDRRFPTTRALAVFVKKLVILAGRSEVDPLNDVELAGIPGRVNIAQSPFGPQITITRAKEQPLSIVDLIRSGMLTEELAAQLWVYVEGLCVKPANLVISGGPGSGKTTLLNALFSFLPSCERLVVIEDTLELNTQFVENCSRLESCRRVKMAALVKNSLRMRPDRIVVGEVRGEEARDLMTAVNVGKYCLGTLHASTARETVMRLQNEPMNVPPLLVSLVDVFVILRRLMKGNTVTRVVGEVVETAGLEQGTVLLSSLWTYDVGRARLVESAPGSVYRERLAQASGLSPIGVMEETLRRTRLLRLMQRQTPPSPIDQVARICQQYLKDPEQAVKSLGGTMKQLLKG